MQLFVLLVAVLLSVQAATVPPVITHKVSVPLPGNVKPVEVPAVVVEVSKDHKHNPDMPVNVVNVEGVTTAVHPGEVVMTTVQTPVDKISGVGVTTLKPKVDEVSGIVVTTAQPKIGKLSEVVSTTIQPKIDEDSGVMVTTLQPKLDEVSGVVVTTVQPKMEKLTEVVVTTVQPNIDDVSGVVVTTVQPKMDEVSGVMVTTVQPKMDEVSGVMVTTVNPLVVDVVNKGSAVEEAVMKPRAKREVTEEAVVSTVQTGDEMITKTNVEEVTTNAEGVTEKVVKEVLMTVVPLTDEMVTDKVLDEVLTTLVPLTDDMVTNKAMDEDVTTVEPNSEDVPTTMLTQDEVVTTVQPTKVNESKEKSNEDSNDSSSEEDSSSSSENKKNSPLTTLLNSPSETPLDELIPAILNRPHIKDEGTVPHITPIPPITADDDSSSSSSSASSEEDDVPKVPLQSDNVVVRRRCAQPIYDKSNLATAKPKLTTDPTVIAEIVSKSKNVHLNNRVMRSVAVEAAVTALPVDDMVLATTIDPCDLLCTKFEIDPICASNGLCLHEFANQCIMDTYNCRHPTQKFSATRDDRCQMHWLDFCKESDLN